MFVILFYCMVSLYNKNQRYVGSNAELLVHIFERYNQNIVKIWIFLLSLSFSLSAAALRTGPSELRKDRAALM